MNAVAEEYVKLVLAVGQHDPDYVDAYYGPEAWRTEAQTAKPSLESIEARAGGLLDALSAMSLGPGDASELRRQYLQGQLRALRTRVAMLRGTVLEFDKESAALYDAVAPVHTEHEFADVLDGLDQRLPGSGSLTSRLDDFRRAFVIPVDRLDAVFQAAIQAGRARTLEHVELPDNERFTVEYVTGRNWSGYNWYQGDFRSLIQVNTELPIFIDRAIDLACHEGYPGHHVYNLLLEQHLLRERGWIEFSVYALYSPQSLIAEGTANFGIEVAFQPADRLAFECGVLFPMAGLDPSRVGEYYDVLRLTEKLSYAGNEAARRLLNGEIDRDTAAQWLERYALQPRARAEQRVRFIEQYRSYVINYNLGKDIVASYVRARAADGDQRGQWAAFVDLLVRPRLPSALVHSAQPS